MDELYVLKYAILRYNGKTTLAPVYGNFCPNCKASTLDIKGYDGGLLVCTVCSHVFSIDDMQDKLAKCNEKMEKQNCQSNNKDHR